MFGHAKFSSIADTLLSPLEYILLNISKLSCSDKPDSETIYGFLVVCNFSKASSEISVVQRVDKKQSNAE